MLSLDRIRESTTKLSDRLYRIEIEKSMPLGCASEWTRIALLYDLHDRSIDDIIDETLGVMDSCGRWRVTIYYWSGELRIPEPRRIMGHGDSFLYNQNPQGDLVLKLDPIEIDLQKGAQHE